MNIRIGNLPPGTTVEEVSEMIGESPAFKGVRITDAGNPDNVVAFIEVDTTHAGAQAIADKINDSFYKERRLNAFAMTLVNE